MVTTFNFARYLLILNSFVICNNLQVKSNTRIKVQHLTEKQKVKFPIISTVSLTQKGYIQFLRYSTKVPPLEEFTFCIWIKSDNYSYPHPLLSYSADGKDRFIRVWISPTGKDINFALLEFPIFKVPVGLLKNHWYNICVTWDNKDSAWALFINGKLLEKGIYTELQNIIIPGGGDLVVGQEYTDMDKGLDDGIEGTIFGFNLVLSSVFKVSNAHLKIHEETLHQRRFTHPQPPSAFLLHPQSSEESLIVLPFQVDFQRRPRPSFIHVSPPYLAEPISIDGKSSGKLLPKEINVEMTTAGGAVASLNTDFKRFDGPTEIKKSLGYRLVELSFNHCSLGNGAPLDGDDVLVSWTKTPVRVFGGAVLTKVTSFC